MAVSSRLPVVVILGATGTGKSKLAIEIGRYFNGEIISADSMQIYKGLDIITNKVTQEEQNQCPHHMIDYLSPLQERNTVVEFRNKAVPIIDRLLGSGKLPIIVGGTSYYIEALLWNFLINTQDVSETQTGKSSVFNQKKILTPEKPIDLSKKLKNCQIDNKNSGNEDSVDTAKVVENIDGTFEKYTTETNRIDDRSSGCTSDQANQPNQEVNESSDEVESDPEDSDDEEKSEEKIDPKTLHQRLQKIDPETARRIHPNDWRKVKRAIQVYEQNGIPMSEMLKMQKSGEPDLAKSGPLRYPHTCVFWIQSEQKVLDERLNKRVDKMLEMGLVQELLDFHHQYNIMRVKENREVDYTLGIFQSIGFKEFHRYLILSPSERDTEEGKQLLEQGIERLKMATRQYAKRQMRRIKYRFLKRAGSNVPPVYSLDATDVSEWENNVYKPAISILTDILQGRQPSYEPLPCESNSENVPVYHVCEACDGMVFVIKKQWEDHVKGRRHQRKVRWLKHRAKRASKNNGNVQENNVTVQEVQQQDTDILDTDVLYKLGHEGAEKEQNSEENITEVHQGHCDVNLTESDQRQTDLNVLETEKRQPNLDTTEPNHTMDNITETQQRQQLNHQQKCVIL